eukprot:tig00000955_g5793.t1
MLAGGQLLVNNTPGIFRNGPGPPPSPGHFAPVQNGPLAERAPTREAAASRLARPRHSVNSGVRMASSSINDVVDRSRALQFWGAVLSVSAVASVVFAIVNLEVRWNRPDDEPASRACDALKALVSALVLTSEVALFLYYRADLQLNIARSLLPESATLLTAGGLVPLLVEALVLAVHAPPRVFLVGSESYNLENLLTVLMVLRLHLVFRAVASKSSLLSPAGRMITALTNSEVTPPLILKTALFQHPLRSLVVVFAALVSSASYCVFVFERWSALVTPSPLDDDRMHFANIMWMTMITIFTVGYGDVYPLTHEGRVVAILASFSGAICTALLIAVVHGQLQLTQLEVRIVTFLSKDKYRREVRHAAASCVQCAWRWHRHRHRRWAGRSEVPRQGPHEGKVTPVGSDESASRPGSGGMLTDARFFAALRRWRALKRKLGHMLNDDEMQYKVLLEQIFSGIQSITQRLDLIGVPREDPKASVLPGGTRAVTRRQSSASLVAGSVHRPPLGVDQATGPAGAAPEGNVNPLHRLSFFESARGGERSPQLYPLPERPEVRSLSLDSGGVAPSAPAAGPAPVPISARAAAGAAAAPEPRPSLSVVSIFDPTRADKGPAAPKEAA